MLGIPSATQLELEFDESMASLMEHRRKTRCRSGQSAAPVNTLGHRLQNNENAVGAFA
ncbi:hypothetical protein [Hydrogenophaga sp.]|uniref:hypothetical protein n=1 Tax=Hydrogenophaga sp. TaxID=1904254 RepID=UPI00271608C1|nr:hypothetical protein [Hydrogenophaga sp.]MDO8905889.1 hypothetical protein [Hydrogenophaga sp.]